MNVVRQAGALLLAALVTSRGLFAQGAVDSPAADSTVVDLRGAPATGSIKGLYVNAWAFGSPKLWQLVRLADETEINAFVVDVKDDTGCLLYPSAVPAAQLAQEAARMGFAEVQFDYVRFPDEPRERMATAIFPAHRSRETQREAVRRHIGLLRDRLKPLAVPVTFDGVGHWRSGDRPGVGGLRQRRGRRAPHALSQPLLPWRLRLRVAQRPAVPRGAERVERRATALAPAPRLRRDPAVPAGVHAGPAPASLHAVRDPRTDSRRGRPRHHIVGAVESAQRVPAGRAASQARQPVSRAAGAVDGERRPLAPPVRAGTRAPCRAAIR